MNPMRHAYIEPAWRVPVSYERLIGAARESCQTGGTRIKSRLSIYPVRKQDPDE